MLFCQRFAECLASRDEDLGDIERLLRGGKTAACGQQSLLREGLHQVMHPFRGVSQHVGLRYLDIGEEELGSVLGRKTELAQVSEKQVDRAILFADPEDEPSQS